MEENLKTKEKLTTFTEKLGPDMIYRDGLVMLNKGSSIFEINGENT